MQHFLIELASKHNGEHFEILDNRNNFLYKKGYISNAGNTLKHAILVHCFPKTHIRYVFLFFYLNDKIKSILKLKNEDVNNVCEFSIKNGFERPNYNEAYNNTFQFYCENDKITKVYAYNPMPIDCNIPFTIEEISLESDNDCESRDRGV